MPEYDGTNRGALFKGKKAQENHPDYEGTINVEGKEYWLNAWLKTSAKGTKYMSLSVKLKQSPSKPAPKGPMADMKDDIPW